MKGLKFFMSFMIAMLFATFVGAATTPAVGVATFVASNLIHIPQGSLGMAVTPEIWTEYIVGNLFKNNEFRRLGAGDEIDLRSPFVEILDLRIDRCRTQAAGHKKITASTECGIRKLHKVGGTA